MVAACDRDRFQSRRATVDLGLIEREFDYTAGAEKSLETAAAEGWTVVSIKNDWATVFE